MPIPTTLSEAVKECPFRTLVGYAHDKSRLQERIGCTIAILGGDLEPLNANIRNNALECFLNGGTVLLVADRADLRDFAKRELIQLMRAAGPSAGLA